MGKNQRYQKKGDDDDEDDTPLRILWKKNGKFLHAKKITSDQHGKEGVYEPYNNPHLSSRQDTDPFSLRDDDNQHRLSTD